MYRIKNFSAVAVVVYALFALPFMPVRAADYGVLKTFWSFAGTWTNSPTVVTNLNSVADCTKFTEFSLQVQASATNNQGGAGSFDFVWETSADGINWPGSTNQIGRTVGWFSAPIQSNAVRTVWSTNIVLDAIGYWRLRHLTNNANMNFTNIQIRAYAKPRRFG
jgi:hypothetical protein